jgi:hypothetical protein
LATSGLDTAGLQRRSQPFTDVTWRLRSSQLLSRSAFSPGIGVERRPPR